jgi:tetratricopeptide (TPR) repeat protein
MAIDTSQSTSGIFTALTLQQTLRDNSSTTALSSGIMLQQKKKYKEALAAFKLAAALKPDSADAYNAIAGAYTMLGKKKEAIEAYRLSLKVNRNQEQVNINIANLSLDLKKPADAEKALKDAITVNSTSVLAHYTLGHLYVQNNRAKEAEAQFRQVVKLVPKDANGLYGLGLALNKQGRYNEAIKTLTTATTLKKDFVPALTELGLAYAALGQTDNAQKQIDVLNKINSTPAILAADDLSKTIKRPKISAYNDVNSSLNLNIGVAGSPLGTSLLLIDPAFITPSARKEVTVQFQFDSEMDAASVSNIVNWRISKPRGGVAGLYDNGMYRATDASTPTLPSRVVYDSTTRQATLTFSLAQNATGNATIDPYHLTFQFLGKDTQGKAMDPSADEYNAFKGVVF